MYRLKPHHTRNQYLRARIDTGAEVNLMPVSVYRLIYQDQDLKKLTQCNLKIGTYMADTIRIIGSTTIYLIHPDSKQPTEMTFHVATNEGSVLLSCNALLNLSLIQSRPRLDYLPPRAILITSKEHHPRKTKTQVQVQKHKWQWKQMISTTNPEPQIKTTYTYQPSKTDFTEIPRHFWRHMEIPRTTISCPDWSKSDAETNSLQTHTDPPQRCVPKRN